MSRFWLFFSCSNRKRRIENPPIENVLTALWYVAYMPASAAYRCQRSVKGSRTQEYYEYHKDGQVLNTGMDYIINYAI
jgi:hypothetical protein